MGLFDRIFRRQEKRPVVQFINEQTGAFTSNCGDAYSNDIYRVRLTLSPGTWESLRAAMY